MATLISVVFVYFCIKGQNMISLSCVMVFPSIVGDLPLEEYLGQVVSTWAAVATATWS